MFRCTAVIDNTIVEEGSVLASNGRIECSDHLTIGAHDGLSYKKVGEMDPREHLRRRSCLVRLEKVYRRACAIFIQGTKIDEVLGGNRLSHIRTTND